jgi:hypothetical protein
MRTLFWALAAALVACRFYQFRPYLDHPHLFRQADTAFYSLGFHRFGMNIFAPSVGWMGSYRHVILEFPLTEWIAAWFYLVTGPTILVDRLVNLGFFLGSAFFLFRIVELVHDQLLARIVTLVYMAAPLGIYYSRAVHIDFTAVCFSHALLFYSLRTAATGNLRDFVAASLAGAVAFAIKAPYAFYLIVPAFLFCHRRRLGIRRWGLVCAAFGVSVAAFLAWFLHSQSVNRQAPDLSAIPSYFPHVNRFRWYFGTFAERLTIEPWRTVIGNVFREIAGTVWWAFVPLALVARARLAGFYAFALAWTAGTFVYLILFLTLNAIHNYYQIPFIAPFSLWLGAAIYACWTARRQARLMRLAAVLALVGYASTSMLVAANRFYRADPGHIAIGDFVRTRTKEDDLVVMAYTISTHADPSFLFYARRYGWSVGHDELSPQVLQALASRGATVAVTSTIWPPDEMTRSYLGTLEFIDGMRIGDGEVFLHRVTPTGRDP